MIKLSLNQAAQITQATLLGPNNKDFSGISHDSRHLNPNELFIAIQGERFNGHLFLQEAKQKGAAGALVSTPMPIDIPQLIVKDTIKALGQLAYYWRNQFSLPIIGVTGSNGKTTVKNMLAQIFSEYTQHPEAVLATEGNLNNHIGLPLMLCSLNANHQFAVIEMGMNHFGEIKYLTELTRPTIALITNAADSHLEGVGNTVAGVAQAKGEIFNGLDQTGTAILNNDDVFYSYWKNQITSPHYSFGFQTSANFFIKPLDDHTGLLHTPTQTIKINLALLGQHNLLNAAAAAAASYAADIPLEIITKGLKKVVSAKGRMQFHCLNTFIQLIDDTYNANPFSLQAAIHYLKNQSGKKILVLGDMKELGEQALSLHAQCGKTIRQSGINYLLTLGELSAETSQAFGKNAFHFTQQAELFNHLISLLKNEKTTLLVKGSRSMKMENMIRSLLTHPF